MGRLSLGHVPTRWLAARSLVSNNGLPTVRHLAFSQLLDTHKINVVTRSQVFMGGAGTILLAVSGFTLAIFTNPRMCSLLKNYVWEFCFKAQVRWHYPRDGQVLGVLQVLFSLRIKVGCYHLFWRIPLLRKIAWISSILLFLEKIMIVASRIVLAVNGMEPKWEPRLWDKDSREESSYDAVRSVQPERSRELQWRLHLDKKRRITNTGLFWESEVVPVETFLTRSMKVFETMKPAMKAKQIIIEFAIDRTWEHHHYALQRVVSVRLQFAF